jgi:transcriptional regulator with XRE-family HTH domain
MKDRINEILKYYKLTSSAFADRIGVQRSGISHILSGRNKPSYDFLVSLIAKFPEVDIKWLMTGKGSMLNDLDDSGKADNIPQSAHKLLFNENISELHTPDLNTSMNSDPDNLKNSYISKQLNQINREIESIVVFYSDGNFRRYISD